MSECHRCRASRTTAGSLEWWALQFCDAERIEFDEPLAQLLTAPELRLWDQTDEPTRKRVRIAHMARWCAARGNPRDLDKSRQEYSIGVVTADPEVQKLVAQGWTLERVELPNGDVQLRLTFPD